MKKTLLLLVAFMATMFSASAQTEMLTDGVITGFESWFGDASWATINTSTAEWDGSKATVNIDQEPYGQWHAQVKFVTSLTQLDPSKNYTFSCKVTSNKAFGGTTLKVMDNVEMYYNPGVELAEGANNVVAKFKGSDAVSNGVIVFDFGNATNGAVLTIENLSLISEDAPEVEAWDPDFADNMWTADLAPNFFYYAPGWAQIANPVYTQNGRSLTLTFPQATTDQWQNQLAFKTELSTSTAWSYDFQALLTADKDINGATVKLVVDGDDNFYYFADRVNLKAGETYIFQKEMMPGKDMAKVNLFFDFGGNQADTHVTIADVVLAKHATDFGFTGDFNGWGLDNKLTLYATSNANVLKAHADSFTTGQWGFKIVKGTEWNGNEWGSNAVIALGVEGALAQGAGNIYLNAENANLTINNAEFTVTLVDGAPATLTVTGDLQESHDDYYMPGTCKGWNFNETTKFTYVSKGVYTLEYDEFYADFKVVKNGSWGSDNEFAGAGNNMMPGNEYTLVKGGDNTGFAPGVVVKNCKFTLTVAEDGTHTLKVEGTAKEEHTYGLVGNFQGWNAGNAPLFEEQADGSWAIDVADFPGGEGFKVSIDKSWTCFCPGSKADGNKTMEFGVPAQCQRVDGADFNIGVSGEKYDVHVVLVVAADAQTATLTITDKAAGITMLQTTVDADAIYNLSGQRLAQPQKGINIINGKKVMVK